MRRARTRESTVNDRLAAVLDARHPRWEVEAESTRVLADGAAKAPDVVVRMPGGASVIIETEYAPAPRVEEEARARLGMTLAETGERVEQVVALRIPGDLGGVPQRGLSAAVARAEFNYCVVSDTEDGHRRFPASGHIGGGVDALAGLVESISVSERRLALAVGELEDGVAQAAAVLRELLVGRQPALDGIGEALHQADGEQTSRMAMTIVANALTFHCAISSTHPRIRPFEALRASGELLPGALLGEWDAILEINYWPIFEIARRVLAPLPADAFREVVGRLSSVAERLVGIGATTIQEMTGQMFGRLIADRKFLATFYTRPASACLLAELAAARLGVDFSSRAALEGLKVADLACGTGALLSAAYGRIAARARRAGLDDSEMHGAFMERVLVGADIMPAAVHVTASMLSAVHPAVPFGDTNVHLMPYGRQHSTGVAGEGAAVIALGSLELIDDVEVASLFGAGRQAASGAGPESPRPVGQTFVLDHGSADLVIMNPPFARTVGQEGDQVGVPRPAFAGFSNSEAEQEAMSTRLAGVSVYRRGRGAAGRGHAGLASHFLDLAHAKVRPGGVIALVLPATFVVSSAWSPARRLLAQHYEDLVVISIAAPGATDRAFSDDTAIAEVLLLATRRRASLPGDLSAGAGADRRGLVQGAVSGGGPGDLSAGVGADRRGLVQGAVSGGGPGDLSAGVGADRRGLVQGAVSGGGPGRPSAGADDLDVPVCWVGLADRPSTVAQSLETAAAVLGSLGRGQAWGELRIGGDRIGVVAAGRLADGGFGQLAELRLAASALALLDGRLELARHRPVELPVTRLGRLGAAGAGNAAIGVKPKSEGPIKRGTGAYAAPFWIRGLGPDGGQWRAVDYPVLWAHDSASGRESRLEVAPDSYGELRPDRDEEQARRVWRIAASKVHVNLEFGLSSQRLGACLTPRACIGGRAWPSFLASAPAWDVPIVLWLNTTPGLIGRWWVGSRQQQGRSSLSVGRIDEIPVLDCRKLSREHLAEASEVFARFRLREFLPANEAYRDRARQDLDEAVLCDLLGLPESILDPLETLREQWCREPTVHGGKRTQPP